VKLRELGRTGLRISEIGFGCGAQAGLMVRGEAQAQARAIARAIELGINYFDTAAQYGDGRSEQNLGRTLRDLKADVHVATKLQFGQAELNAGKHAVRALLDASLSRLGRDSVDVLYYHGRLRRASDVGARDLTAADALGPLLAIFRDFQHEGLTRFIGFTALGQTDAVLEAIRPGAFDAMQCYVNAVNPSAAYPAPSQFGPQDLGGILTKAASVGMGVAAIRILAAGALAATERHPLSGGGSGPAMAGADYATDVSRAARLEPLAKELGISMAELAIRFALSVPGVSTALVGVSDVTQIEFAVHAEEAGPLPDHVVTRIVALNEDPA
jgi:aryl-alcohol dehydrogenase-like predicted oxidoreductase